MLTAIERPVCSPVFQSLVSLRAQATSMTTCPRSEFSPVPWPSLAPGPGYCESRPSWLGWDLPRTQQAVGQTNPDEAIAGNWPESARMDRRRRARARDGSPNAVRVASDGSPITPAGRSHRRLDSDRAFSTHVSWVSELYGEGHHDAWQRAERDRRRRGGARKSQSLWNSGEGATQATCADPEPGRERRLTLSPRATSVAVGCPDHRGVRKLGQARFTLRTSQDSTTSRLSASSTRSSSRGQEGAEKGDAAPGRGWPP